MPLQPEPLLSCPALVARWVDMWNHGLRVSTMVGDVRSRPQLQEIIRHTVEQHGGLDIMIANAGVLLVRMLPHSGSRRRIHGFKVSPSMPGIAL